MNGEALENAIEAARRGIEDSDAYYRPWHEPASSSELAKAALLGLIEEGVFSELEP